MNRVTLICAYYRNGGMLARQYVEWAALRPEIKAHLEVIVVDDGSPDNRAVDVARPDGLPALRLYAMRRDIRWGQDACRNLGAAEAAHPWLLLTDIDHIVTAELMERVVAGKLKSGNVYKFGRVSAPNLAPYKQHPNSWLMTRVRYDDAGGYDERLCGFYGTDAFFRDSVLAATARAGGSLEMLKEPLIRVPREVIADASTPLDFGRKSEADAHAIRKIRDVIATLPEDERRPKRGLFAWDRTL